MSDFDRITSSDEITRILKSAEALGAEVHCEVTGTAGPARLIELDIRGVSGTNVVLGLKRHPGQPGQMLNAVFTQGLEAGAPIEVVFSLVDGQYAIRETVQDISLTTFTVGAGRNLLRLQRRKDFRVSVKADGLAFVTKTSTGEIAFDLIDLSAGGLRLSWPPSAGPIPSLGTLLDGVLYLSRRDPVTEKGTSRVPPAKSVTAQIKLVKDHGQPPQVVSTASRRPEQAHALSFQFQGLGQEDARTILFTCLFIHRQSYGS